MARPKVARRPLVSVKHSRRAVRTYTEKTLQEACNYLDTHPGETTISTAQKFGIPKSTLSGRYRGLHAPAREAHESQQWLTAEEEIAVADWLEHLADQGCPVKRITILSVVNSI